MRTDLDAAIKRLRKAERKYPKYDGASVGTVRYDDLRAVLYLVDTFEWEYGVQMSWPKVDVVAIGSGPDARAYAEAQTRGTANANNTILRRRAAGAWEAITR